MIGPSETNLMVIQQMLGLQTIREPKADDEASDSHFEYDLDLKAHDWALRNKPMYSITNGKTVEHCAYFPRNFFGSIADNDWIAVSRG